MAGDPAWTDVIVSARLRSLDNDAIGLVFRYADIDNYYRFSMDSERGYRRLVKNVDGGFSRLWEDDFTYEIDRTYEIVIAALGNTVRGYLDGVPMFAVEDSELSTGRVGLYCWGNSDARFSDVRVYSPDRAFDDWLLDESFDISIPGRWTFVNEGDQEGPSIWELIAGELRQTSNIFGGDTAGSAPEKPGTYAVAGDAGWTDYRVTVRLTSDDDDAIGLMFRHQDANNYYRFSMDRQRSYRRLVKNVAGEFTVLWEDMTQYGLGREYILTVDCIGERLTGYIDGIQLFQVEDNQLANGRIALYCWRNTGARFSEVRIGAPVWSPYYVFGRQERLPAGTRVKVYAGNKADAPADEPGLVRRFVATLDDRGRLRLPIQGIDLRLKAPGETGGHMRRFLPETDYAPIDSISVLRKADGTGFFIVLPADSPVGSRLPFGQYRVKMTYHRDNRSAEPDSQVLSEAGSSTPEHVTLDIPWCLLKASAFQSVVFHL